MRLICPNCDAQYEVSDSAIPAGGRDVQCSNCGNTWYQLPSQAVSLSPRSRDLLASKNPASSASSGQEADTVATPATRPRPVGSRKPRSITISPSATVEPELPPAAAESAASSDVASVSETETLADSVEASAVGSENISEDAISDAAAAAVQVPDSDLAPVEATPPAFDSPPPLPRRKLDEGVVAVLREEAERETAARQADMAATSPPDVASAKMDDASAQAPTSELRSAPAEAEEQQSAERVAGPIEPVAGIGTLPEALSAAEMTNTETAAPDLAKDSPDAEGESGTRKDAGSQKDSGPLKDLADLIGQLSAADTSPRPAATAFPPLASTVSAPQSALSVEEQIAAVLVDDGQNGQKAGKGRERLPDIEEIKSTLRSSSDRGVDSTEDGAEEDDLPQRRRGFRRGFALMLLIGVLALMAYVFAPAIIRTVPQSESYLRAYVGQVNDARYWLDGLMQQASTSLQSDADDVE
jgi:predicted Zn finger-like uncharacterized protein